MTLLADDRRTETPVFQSYTLSHLDALEAEAVFVFSIPQVGNQPTSGTWNLKPEIFQVFARSMRFTNTTTGVVTMKKEKKE